MSITTNQVSSFLLKNKQSQETQHPDLFSTIRQLHVLFELRNHVQISSKFAPKKIVPYAAFQQVILVFR